MDTYRVTITSNNVTPTDDIYLDWANVMPEGQYEIIPSLSSKYFNFDTALPLMCVYSNMLNCDTYTTEGAIIQANPTQFICEAQNRGYNSGYDNFNCTATNRLSLFSKTRPKNNNFRISLIASNGVGYFASTSLGVTVELTLQFIRYTLPLFNYRYSHYEIPTPFNVILNSKNGDMLNNSINQINYNYNWFNHVNVNQNQKYKMSMLFIMMGVNMVNAQPLQIHTDFFNNMNNFVVDNTGYKTSNIILSGVPSAFVTLVNICAGMTTNTPITVILPQKNNFNVEIYQMGTTTLFTQLNDYILQLHFEPII